MTETADQGWLYRRIVENSPMAILFADREGQIRLWNSGAETVFGYTEREALGKSLDLIVPERQRAQTLGRLGEGHGERRHAIWSRRACSSGHAERRLADLHRVQHRPRPRRQRRAPGRRRHDPGRDGPLAEAEGAERAPRGPRGQRAGSGRYGRMDA